ncbi:MAG: hypothetical protein HY537_06640 [Deltaproteobacteria bacterium]|nr:hypothetical protein [Deltaproteobacteria bacterium]
MNTVRFGGICGWMLPVLFCTFCFLSAQTYALKYTGRILLGSFTSRERFGVPSAGSYSNDFATLSERLRLNVSEIANRNLQFTLDLRDKHDFFDKLDRERLELTGNNTFQVRQLSSHYENASHSLFGTIGRFPVSEAGDTHADGVEFGGCLSRSTRLAGFAGLNPKTAGRTYLEFTPQAQAFGAYLLYEPVNRSWNQYLYLTNAVSAQMVSGVTDRLFWFSNLVWQWNSGNRLVTLLYLDFIPRLYVQNGQLSYFHEWMKNLSTTLAVSIIDVIEYSRRSGLRERLEPSPYREGSVSARYVFSPSLNLVASGLYGSRLADSLLKKEVSLGLSSPRLFSPHFSGYATLGVRHHFTSDDIVMRVGLGYYSQLWEITVDQNYSIEKDNNGTTDHPIVSEGAIALYLSRALYGTCSVQYAHDQAVDIFSTFLQIGYRFGNEAIPTVRDGAPPRGRL